MSGLWRVAAVLLDDKGVEWTIVITFFLAKFSWPDASISSGAASPR